MSTLPPGEGLLASLRGLLSTALALLQTRVALFATELEEEKLRLLSVLVFGVAALLLLSIGAVFLAIFLTLLFWDTHRLLVIGCATLVFLMGGSGAWLLAQRQIRSASRLFAASLAELQQDRNALQAGPRETR